MGTTIVNVSDKSLLMEKISITGDIVRASGFNDINRAELTCDKLFTGPVTQPDGTQKWYKRISYFVRDKHDFIARIKETDNILPPVISDVEIITEELPASEAQVLESKVTQAKQIVHDAPVKLPRNIKKVEGGE